MFLKKSTADREERGVVHMNQPSGSPDLHDIDGREGWGDIANER